MRIITGFWALALLTAGAALTPAGAQDCGLEQLATIDMTVDAHRITLPVSFGEVHKDMNLRLDQAANQITSEAAKELDLRLTAMSENIHVKRPGGEVAYMAKASDFRLGKFRVRDVDFLLLPPDDHRNGVAGDLGTHIFNMMDFELDMAGGKFLLFSTDHCKGKVVHWTATGFTTAPFITEDTGYIRVQMELDGKPVSLALNTAGSSIIGMNTMRRIFGVDAASPGMTLADTTPDGHKMYRYPFKSLQAGGLNIANPAFLIRDEPPTDTPCDGKPHSALDQHKGGFGNKLLYEHTCMGGRDGDLGLAVLAKLHLYFSRKEQLVYITGADAK